jgi:hypothetical protein
MSNTIPSREEYEKMLAGVLEPVYGKMSRDEYDDRYSVLELGLLENLITPQQYVDMFNKLLDMYQTSRPSFEGHFGPREFI